MMEPFVEGVESLMAWVGSMFKQNLEDYCMLETAENEHSLVMSNGELVSIIAVHGCRDTISESAKSEDFNAIHQHLWSSIQSYFDSKAHAIQVFFERDADGIKDEISRRYHGARETAKSLNLSMDDLFDDVEKNYSRYCSIEKNFFVLITRPTAMTKSETLRAKEIRKELYKQTEPSLLGQDLFLVADAIRDRHNAFVDAMMTDFNTINMEVSLLDVHRAVREIRKTVEPKFVAENWTPYLPGDKIPFKIMRNYSRDISDLQWPRLSSQIFTQDAHEEGRSEFMRVGNMIYAPVFVELGPKDPQLFSVLFKRLNSSNIPWRISFLIEPGGIDSISLNATMASFLSFTNSANKLIDSAKDELIAYIKDSGDSDVKLKISLCTWVYNNDLTVLRDRLARLARSVEGWGICTTQEISGDPIEGVLSSALSIKTDSIANFCAAPLRDVIGMLPITRPSSPWETGSNIFRTEDGKIWPYQPGSEKQNAWIDLTVATMGAGKSVLQNKINLALCLSPGIKRLPRIAIIDIGPSSSGLISLIKESLPENQRHLASYHRIQMTKDFSINPFDTPLGCPFPNSGHREFLMNFMIILLTPVGHTSPKHEALSDMVGLVIDEVYKLVSPNNRPKLYVKNFSEKVDLAIVRHSIEIDQKTTWWEISDALFKVNDTHTAGIAQTFASPLLEDCIEASRSEAIRNLYERIVIDQESVVDTFSRMISASVREFPVLAYPTKFDLGEARVVSLDLDEVAKGDSDSSVKQTSLMYMLARYIMARDFYLLEEHVADMPKAYQGYHLKRVMELKEDIKKICMDEYHRTRKSPSVREQVLRDIREGRKWGVHISLVSQLIEDFAGMEELATSIFILSGDQKQTINKIAETFGFSDTVKWNLEHKVHGPTKSGASFIARIKTKTHTATQLITNSLGSIEYWAFSTTPSDTQLRGQLYKALGPSEARLLLSKHYPYGIQKEVERRITLMSVEGYSDEGNDDSIINAIFKELIDLSKGLNEKAS